jgi:hypothetical protein
MRTMVFVVTALAFGCGKKGGDEKKDPPPATGGGSAAGVMPSEPAKKGAPPKDVYKGKNRLVNLYVGPDGKTQTVDVWVRRGFKYDPVMLAEKVEFGKASTWFGIPQSMSPVVLPTGAKPDDKELSPMAYGKADEVVTGILQNSGGRPSVSTRYDVSASMPGAPQPPTKGKGTLVLDAGQLSEFEKVLAEKFGGRSFYVGDGTGACRPPRDPKMESLALGGTAEKELELDPGKAKITLHKWPGQKGEECKTPAVYEFEADVVADKAQRVYIFTPDGGKSLSTLTITVNE